MRRDMDLAREIVLALEGHDSYTGFQNIGVEGYTEDQVSYHVMLLNEAGLIEAVDLSTMSGVSWKPVRLTWEGHEFLDASRDESRWSKAKSALAKVGGGLAYEVLKDFLISSMKQAVGLPS